MLLHSYSTNNSSWGPQCILLLTNLTAQRDGSVGEVLVPHCIEGDTVEWRGISRLYRKIKGRMFYLSLCIQTFIERMFKEMGRWTTTVFYWQVGSGIFWRLWQLKQSPQVRRKTPAERAPLIKLHDRLKAYRSMASSKDINCSSKKGGFQNYSPYRMQNNLNLRQMMTARLPSHVRLLLQNPWRLPRLMGCHHMTPPKEKSTWSSRGSLTRKYLLTRNSVSVLLP